MVRALEELEEALKEALNCTRCRLSEARTRVVFGEGDLKTSVMLIGEAPGFNEDREGRPFVGQAGKFLNETLLKAAGLERSSVYVTNVVKCRPPGNREPTDDEVEACFPYLSVQIRVIRPKIIVTLGNVATNTLFRKFNIKPAYMSSVHGKVFNVNTLSYGSFKIIPSYHPASALYNPGMSKVMIEDWLKIGMVVKNL
ncbi:MAG: uracil-DNA glycosylase [Thaumarchaeota archaeon]|jgi:DNA polymerase|nr:uracil-DNA glycosylase [Nitrososphaerota archaeon]